ncbi:hypothetical protein EVAR_46948_1 [Eumeta japonica]|uniref:Uncharacterized protein n=1 Tax=Eumeta variegata TaxID=151549 RepID=A0A4C1YLV7_EUMVA|nr:hypothetical protein EVAR_46948_1 [Eumeta japonica]
MKTHEDTCLGIYVRSRPARYVHDASESENRCSNSHCISCTLYAFHFPKGMHSNSVAVNATGDGAPHAAPGRACILSADCGGSVSSWRYCSDFALYIFDIARASDRRESRCSRRFSTEKTSRSAVVRRRAAQSERLISAVRPLGLEPNSDRAAHGGYAIIVLLAARSTIADSRPAAACGSAGSPARRAADGSSADFVCIMKCVNKKNFRQLRHTVIAGCGPAPGAEKGGQARPPPRPRPPRLRARYTLYIISGRELVSKSSRAERVCAT